MIEAITQAEIKAADALTTKELWKRFNEAINATTNGYRQMALYYTALEKRGEDLYAYDDPRFELMSNIVNGSVIPEVLVVFGGRPIIMHHVATLPVEDQRKLVAENAKVPVAQHDGSVKQKPALALTTQEWIQVTGDDGMLPPNKQKPPAPKRTPIPRPAEPNQWDKEAFTADEREAILIVAESEDLTSLEFIAHQSRTPKGFVMTDVLKRAAPKRKAAMKKAAPKKRAGINAH